jgi:hypothetical protein
MNVAEYIYYANVLKNLDIFLSLISFLMLVWAGIYTLYYLIENDKYHKQNYLIIAPLLLLFITIFIPSERTMYMMAGAAVGEKVIESKAGKQALEIIELKLDEEINKLKGKK